MEAFGVSRSTVYNYINRLQEAGELERVGGSMPYRILYHTTRFTIDTSKEKSEDRVFLRDIAPLLEELPMNAQKIWRYAITAMLNNAMEHSRASAIVVVVNQSRLCTIVGVLDNGVGIFRRIRQDWLKEAGEVLTTDEAAALLYAGKYTGAPETHAGEGIFFTSHLMDHFAIRSETALFTLGNDDEERGGAEPFRGTAVQMALANDTDKDLQTVMARFLDPEEGFVHTEIPVAKLFGGGFPVSRSEAKRLGEILSGFKPATLDFTGVPEIGPDFAHELFGVIIRARGDLVLIPGNANESVLSAIRRAERG
jgi:hypothetical protein